MHVNGVDPASGSHCIDVSGTQRQMQSAVQLLSVLAGLADGPHAQ
jgi:hypothetical protein